MNTLENRFESVITDKVEIFCDMIAGTDLAAKACTDITIEFAKGFTEWVTITYYFISPSGKWYNSNVKNQCWTTEELITTYINTIK